MFVRYITLWWEKQVKRKANDPIPISLACKTKDCVSEFCQSEIYLCTNIHAFACIDFIVCYHLSTWLIEITTCASTSMKNVSSEVNPLCKSWHWKIFAANVLNSVMKCRLANCPLVLSVRRGSYFFVISLPANNFRR